MYAREEGELLNMPYEDGQPALARVVCTRVAQALVTVASRSADTITW